MSLYDRIFEAVDRDYQQKRLNKINKPIAKRAKDAEDKMFQLGSYHPEYSKLSMQHSHDSDSLERIKKLKTLSKARGDLAKSPDDEKLQRKRDNASDAVYPWHHRMRERRV